MLGHHELNKDDYLAALRRRRWLILLCTVLGGAIAYGVSFLIKPDYKSEALLLVEQPEVPDSVVKPVVTEDLIERMRKMQEQLFSRSRLQPIIERYNIYKNERPVTEAVADKVRQRVSVTVLQDFLKETGKKKNFLDTLKGYFSTDADTGSAPSQPAPAPAPTKPGQTPVTGLAIAFTNEDPRTAQQVCAEITSVFLEENLRQRKELAQTVKTFLANKVAEAKRNLDAEDTRLAEFKRRYLGALPEEEQSNLQLLMTLNSRLTGVNEQSGRAEQDKAYAETLLAQELAGKTTQSGGSSNAEKKEEKDLADMRQKLALLEGRYTSSHPDVIKLKKDIEQTEKDIEAQATLTIDKSGKAMNATSEPPHIQQLRAQIHQDEESISSKTSEAAALQNQIKMYDGRIQLSPGVEAEYKEITRDHKAASDFYNDLLTKLSQSDMASDMEQQQEGEVVKLVDAANLPTDPTFPDRTMFSLAGLGGGLGLGLALGLLLELLDSALRTERDVELTLRLPALATVPVLGDKKRRTRNWANKAGFQAKQPVGLGL